MKLILSELLNLLAGRQERNVRLLAKFLCALVVMITVYSVAFHFVMLHEQREFSWITGLYWTLTVMSTLGFGDITFASDFGKLFSVIVLLSGIIFLLTILPFTFIQFVYLPWMESQKRARIPFHVTEKTRQHVILADYDPIADNLIERLKQYDYQYVVVIQDRQRAVELHDLGHRVVAGDLDDPETYRRINAQDAALVLANLDDMTNTNMAFTIRDLSPNIPIIANAEYDESVDVLELAGCTYVFQFMKMLGESLARRVLGTSTRANVIGNVYGLLIAEASAMRTPLEGKTLEQLKLRERTGTSVVGVWERGRFEVPAAQTLITPSSVLLLAGSADQLRRYDEEFGYQEKYEAPVLILGGGRVGCAAARGLRERHVDYRIIENDPDLVLDDHYVHGSAADIRTLLRAGIEDAPSVLITTHDDPTNIYLTIYCRKLRPDIQIITRANFARNIKKLHSAGADLVMSYASMAASMILNILKPGELLMLAEGLNVFRAGVPKSLAGRSLSESRIGRDTGCSVIAVNRSGTNIVNPDIYFRLELHDELILIGTTEAERRFFKKHGETNNR